MENLAYFEIQLKGVLLDRIDQTFDVETFINT